MKLLLSGIALSAGIVMFSIVSARAQSDPTLPAKADLASLNCASIFNMKRTETVMVLAWLQRHYASAEKAKTLDQEKLYDDGLKLHLFCESNPEKTVMQAADLLFGGQ
jgi:HdeA/HdeB family